MTIEILNAFLTTAVASLAIVIAWKQHRTEAQRLRFDMFDRRMKVYQNLDDILFELEKGELVVGSKKAAVCLQELSKESNFLFSKDIGDYLEELRLKAEGLLSEKDKLKDMHGDDNVEAERGRAAKKKEKINSYFSEQHRQLYERFSPYLTVEQPFFLTKRCCEMSFKCWKVVSTKFLNKK